MSVKRLAKRFGVTGIPFSPDARYITAPAVVPESMAAFFEALRGVVAYQHPMVFLIEARIGAGKTTIFSNIINAINQNKVGDFLKKNRLEVESVTLQDFEMNKGIAFRVEMSSDIADHPEEYVQKLYTAIDTTLHSIDNEKFQLYTKKRKAKWDELAPRLHDLESKTIFPLTEAIYLLLDKSEGAGFDYITAVLDEFDTIITEDPKKVDAFLDFVVRKFVEKLKEKKPHWATSDPKICLVLLCTRFRSDQVRTQIERIGSGAVPRTFIPGPRLGYTCEEFHDIVKRRLEEFRPRRWSGNNYFPFTRQLIDKVYDAFYDKAAECLTNMGLAEQTLYEIFSKWDAASEIDEKVALETIENMRRVHVTTETITDLAIETEVSRISATDEVDERVGYILDGFLAMLERQKVKPSEETATGWITKPIEKAKCIWFSKPYDIEFQGKSRKIYVTIVEFVQTPTDNDVKDVLEDIDKRFINKRDQIVAPQGLILLYRSSTNKDNRFREVFTEIDAHFNKMDPAQLDEPTLKNLIKLEVAKRNGNTNVENVASGELARLALDIERFLQDINDLFPTQQFKFTDEKKQVYVGLLLAFWLEGRNDEVAICRYCNKVFKEIVNERGNAYKTVSKIMSFLVSDGFAEEIEYGKWKPLSPFTIRYFFDLWKTNAFARVEDTIERVFGTRWMRMNYLFNLENDDHAYDILRIKDGKTELLTKSEASLDYRNLKEKVIDMKERIFGTRKAEIPVLNFATDIEKVASKIDDEFQSVLLLRYACKIVDEGILEKVNDLEELLKKLQETKIPKDILSMRESEVKEAAKAILMKPLEVANEKYIQAYNNLQDLLEEGTEEAKAKSEEEREKTIAEEEEGPKVEIVPAVEEDRIMELVSSPRSLSELSEALKISKEVVFDKVDPLIRDDVILLTSAKKRKRSKAERKRR